LIDTTGLALGIKTALDKAFISTSPTTREELATDLAVVISEFASKLEIQLTHPINVVGSTTPGGMGGPLIAFNARTTII